MTNPNYIDPTLDLEAEIDRMRREMNAVILAHYYQEPELQDMADFIGDSLDLSRKAAATDADVIVFCGVKFMAEVAKILSPNKKVLLPDMLAGCSLEDSCQPVPFKAFCDQHPDHMVLSYINCSADIKALSDIIVTSSNAKYIIDQLPQDQKIIFAPDKHLGSYINKVTGRDMLLWQGSCIVHEQFSERELVRLKTKHPNAHIIAHPECPETLLSYAELVGSTKQLLQFVADHPNSEMIVLTEPGILYQMQKASPNATLYSVDGLGQSGCEMCNACPHMKRNTLEKLYLCMKNQTPELNLDEDLRIRAKKSLDKMLEMSPPAK